MPWHQPSPPFPPAWQFRCRSTRIKMQLLSGLPAPMADRLTAAQRRLNMSRVRSKGTAPEMTVRRILHSQGLRFRLHRGDLPGTPDIVLPRYQLAIFVHGCFWHGHHCPLFRAPSTRTDFWTSKIDANRRRDVTACAGLVKLGWRTLCIWECAVRGRGKLTERALLSSFFTFLSDGRREAEIAGWIQAPE